MLIYWLPYLTLAYPHRGPREISVGKATFFEDSPTNWTSIVGRERPKHLEIHRDFPVQSEEGIGDPLYGTLVQSDNETWLTEHIDPAIAVLYFLGDEFRRGRPAECFAYHRISLDQATSGGDDLVGYWTKHGYLMESSTSLVLYPSLAVRGNQTAYRLSVDNTEDKELLRRFTENPFDRLVVSVRQYFRTQFTDIFTSPLAEDYALHCGAIEAALDIDALKPGVSERFVDELAALYGKHDHFEEFFLGLYVSRSLFVHGASSTQAETSDTKEAKAYRRFKNARCKATLMRKLTRDVIRQKLGRKDDPFGFNSHDSALPLLGTVLHSDDTWDKLRSILCKGKATDHLLSIKDEEFEEFSELAFQVNNYFDWQCLTKSVEPKKVLKSLCTCALAIAKLTGSKGPVYEQSDRLGKAADKSDEEALESWILDDPWNDVCLIENDRLTTFQRIARGLAKYFDKHHLVPWQ